jgi:hypothetical protein
VASDQPRAYDIFQYVTKLHRHCLLLHVSFSRADQMSNFMCWVAGFAQSEGGAPRENGPAEKTGMS